MEARLADAQGAGTVDAPGPRHGRSGPYSTRRARPELRHLRDQSPRPQRGFRRGPGILRVRRRHGRRRVEMGGSDTVVPLGREGRLRCRRRRSLIIRSDCRVARFGPTTPTRATRLYDASVDPTDARKATVRRVGRSDRSALRHPWLLRSIRPKRATAKRVFETGPFNHSGTPPSAR